MLPGPLGREMGPVILKWNPELWQRKVNLVSWLEWIPGILVSRKQLAEAFGSVEPRRKVEWDEEDLCKWYTRCNSRILGRICRDS